jgi:hypothetical protein
VTFGSGGVTATQGKADRHPHDVLDATMDTAVRSSRTACRSYASLAEGGLHRLHISPLVIVVRLTMWMLGACNV